MESGIGYDQEDIDKTLSDGSIDADFADKFVGDEVVRRIATALTNDSTKKRVLLDRNCIGADGAAALGEMLKVWLRQIKLDLGKFINCGYDRTQNTIFRLSIDGTQKHTGWPRSQ